MSDSESSRLESVPSSNDKHDPQQSENKTTKSVQEKSTRKGKTKSTSGTTDTNKGGPQKTSRQLDKNWDTRTNYSVEEFSKYASMGHFSCNYKKYGDPRIRGDRNSNPGRQFKSMSHSSKLLTKRGLPNGIILATDGYTTYSGSKAMYEKIKPILNSFNVNDNTKEYIHAVIPTYSRSYVESLGCNEAKEYLKNLIQAHNTILKGICFTEEDIPSGIYEPDTEHGAAVIRAFPWGPETMAVIDSNPEKAKEIVLKLYDCIYEPLKLELARVASNEQTSRVITNEEGRILYMLYTVVVQHTFENNNATKHQFVEVALKAMDMQLAFVNIYDAAIKGDKDTDIAAKIASHITVDRPLVIDESVSLAMPVLIERMLSLLNRRKSDRLVMLTYCEAIVSRMEQSVLEKFPNLKVIKDDIAKYEISATDKINSVLGMSPPEKKTFIFAISPQKQCTDYMIDDSVS